MEQTLVIILNYNGKKELEYCLPSVVRTAGCKYQILLTDNASRDDSVKYVRSEFQDIQIIQNSQNFAWAEGNNIAIRYGLKNNFDYYALLNNDIILPDFWLSQAITLFESVPDAGIIGFDVIGFTTKEPIEKYNSVVADWKTVSFSYADNISGCCMLIKREVFDAVGLIDKVYYKYGEEVDFICRTLKAGFKVIKTNIPVWHAVAATSSKMPYSTAYYCIRNDIRFALKQKGILHALMRLLKLVYTITIPFITINASDHPLQRLKPGGYIINNIIFIFAVIWNVLFLPQTLCIRLLENRRIKKYLMNHSG